MQKSEKIYLCLDEKHQTVCKLYEVLFVPVEVGMIWWTERFGNGYKYIHELSIEDVLKPEVHHRPDIQEEGKVISKFGNSSNQKNLGLTLHWTKTFVNFWKGVLNQTTQPTQARMLGKTTNSGRCKCERFSPRILGKSRMGRLGKTLFQCVFFSNKWHLWQQQHQ